MNKSFRFFQNAYRTIRIDGSVDVHVYEFNRKLVAQIIDNDPQDVDTHIVAAPEFTDNDHEFTKEGSRLNYELDKDDIVINPDVDISGKDAKAAKFRVNIEFSNFGYGFTVGSGSYTLGSFAQVHAITGEDNFLGWYMDNQLVYQDPVYRFRVTEDVNLVAQFGTTPYKHVLPLYS